jgi:hypothetical protein
MTPDARAFVLTSSNERGEVPSAKMRFPVPNKTGKTTSRTSSASRAQPASEEPDTVSLHLLVERVDIALHRFVLDGRVKIVWQVNRNQILRHTLSFYGLRASSTALRTASSSYSRRAGNKSTAWTNFFILISRAASGGGQLRGILRG